MKTFVRAKRQGDKSYNYLVTSVRVGNRVRQRVVLYLGEYESLEDAQERLPLDIGRFLEQGCWWRVKAGRSKRVLAAGSDIDFTVPSYSRYGRHIYGDHAKRYWQRIRKAEKFERAAKRKTHHYQSVLDLVRGKNVVPNLLELTFPALGTTPHAKDTTPRSKKEIQRDVDRLFRKTKVTRRTIKYLLSPMRF